MPPSPDCCYSQKNQIRFSAGIDENEYPLKGEREPGEEWLMNTPLPHLDDLTTQPTLILLFSFFAKRNKQSNSQANDYHPPHNLIWTTWPLNQRKVSQISTLLPPRFCSCCSYTYFLFWKRRCHFLIWASGHIFCSSSWWLTCPSWPGGRQQFSLSFHPSNITFVLSYRCTKTKTSGAL